MVFGLRKVVLQFSLKTSAFQRPLFLNHGNFEESVGPGRNHAGSAIPKPEPTGLDPAAIGMLRPCRTGLHAATRPRLGLRCRGRKLN